MVSVKRSVVELFHHAINPTTRKDAGSSGNRYALLETVGRKSGERRQTPVGNGLDGDVFWIVAEHGLAANYVQNLIANPHVRVKADGAWRPGTAVVLSDDDPHKRLELLNPANAREVRLIGTSLLTVRIDLSRSASN